MPLEMPDGSATKSTRTVPISSAMSHAPRETRGGCAGRAPQEDGAAGCRGLTALTTCRAIRRAMDNRPGGQPDRGRQGHAAPRDLDPLGDGDLDQLDRVVVQDDPALATPDVKFHEAGRGVGVLQDPQANAVR